MEDWLTRPLGASVPAEARARFVCRGRSLDMAWVIELVTCRDGVVDKSGDRLVRGLLYASDKRRGGPRSFYEIDSGSLQIYSVSVPDAALKVFLRGPEGCWISLVMVIWTMNLCVHII